MRPGCGARRLAWAAPPEAPAPWPPPHPLAHPPCSPAPPCRAGKVGTKGQPCIPPELARQGYVTLCTARPQSDCTLQTHQGAAVRRLRREALTK